MWFADPQPVRRLPKSLHATNITTKKKTSEPGAAVELDRPVELDAHARTHTQYGHPVRTEFHEDGVSSYAISKPWCLKQVTHSNDTSKPCM